MKRIHFLLLVIFTILVVVLSLFFYLRKKNAMILGQTIISYTLNNKRINLLVADTEEEWEQGLMDRKKLDGADGMIFIFPDSRPRSFWNKNTYLNLDIYWINQHKVVGKVFLPSIEKTGNTVTISSPSSVDAVIELVRR